MTIWDDRILEAIRKDGPLPVGDLVDCEGIRITQSSVSRRCQKLAENGLLQPIGNGVYDITEIGEAYLEEDYDAENGRFIDEQTGPDGPTASESTET
jgi:DNA-binding Lrp family transcriptional regulator